MAHSVEDVPRRWGILAASPAPALVGARARTGSAPWSAHGQSTSGGCGVVSRVVIGGPGVGSRESGTAAELCHPERSEGSAVRTVDPSVAALPQDDGASEQFRLPTPHSRFPAVLLPARPSAPLPLR